MENQSTPVPKHCYLFSTGYTIFEEADGGVTVRVKGELEDVIEVSR